MSVLSKRVTPAAMSVVCHIALGIWLENYSTRIAVQNEQSHQMIHITLITTEPKASTRNAMKLTTQSRGEMVNSFGSTLQSVTPKVESTIVPETEDQHKNPSTLPITRPGPWINTDKQPFTFVKNTQDSALARAIASAGRPDCLKRGESNVSGLFTLPSLLVSAINGECN